MTLGQKQSVESLTYILFNRPLHPELFQIYHEHRILQPEFEAVVWVTGCSHLVSFYAGPESLTELIVGVDEELPARGLLAEYRMRGEKQHEHLQGGRIHYQMSFQVEVMSRKLYARTHQDLARAASKHGLFVPFPQWRISDLTPFTFIDYQVTPESLHLFSYHAFPDEMTLVKAQSLFELSKPSSPGP